MLSWDFTSSTYTDIDVNKKSLGYAYSSEIIGVFYPSGNTSSQRIPYYLNSRIISGSVIHAANESFHGDVYIRLEHTKVCK